MTLKQKREIVRRFLGGESIREIQWRTGWCNMIDMEDILRDFINGRFSLEPKRKVKE